MDQKKYLAQEHMYFSLCKKILGCRCDEWPKHGRAAMEANLIFCLIAFAEPDLIAHGYGQDMGLGPKDIDESDMDRILEMADEAVKSLYSGRDIIMDTIMKTEPRVYVGGNAIFSYAAFWSKMNLGNSLTEDLGEENGRRLTHVEYLQSARDRLLQYKRDHCLHRH